MTEDNGVRFLLDEKNQAANFVYRPPDVTNSNIPQDQNATRGVKFAQGVYFLDPWGFMLIGKTRWQRIVFRLQHPIAYTRRGWWKLYRKIKGIFIEEKVWKCNLVKPKEKNNGTSQKQTSAAQQN